MRYRQAPWLEHRFKIGGNTETGRFSDPVDVPPDFPGADTINKTTENRLFFDYNAAVSAPKVLEIAPTLVVGASYEEEHFVQDNNPAFGAPNPTDERRHTWSGYGELAGGLAGPHLLQRGGRYDDSTAFGEAFSPRVTLAAVVPVTETRLCTGPGGRASRRRASSTSSAALESPAIPISSPRSPRAGRSDSTSRSSAAPSRPGSHTSTTTSAT